MFEALGWFSSPAWLEGCLIQMSDKKEYKFFVDGKKEFNPYKIETVAMFRATLIVVTVTKWCKTEKRKKSSGHHYWICSITSKGKREYSKVPLAV